MAEKKVKVKKVKVEKPKKFQFEVGEEFIYVGGLYDAYRGKECVILSRSKEKKKEWYNVRFIHNKDEMLVIPSVLKRKEELIESNITKSTTS